MPLWILFSVPGVAIVSGACAIAFDSYPIVAGIAGTAGAIAIATSFVVFPVAIWTLAANRQLRTAPQIIGTTLCALPILGMVASLLLGGI